MAATDEPERAGGALTQRGESFAVVVPRHVAIIGGEPEDYESLLDTFTVHHIDHLDRARAHARGVLGRRTWLYLVHASGRLPPVEVACRIRVFAPWADVALVLQHDPTPQERVGIYSRGVVAVEVKPTPAVACSLVYALARRHARLVRVRDG